MSSSLIVEVCLIDKISRHENSDNLDLGVIKGWQVVLKKDQYKEGDKVLFIPPDALLPIELADKLNVRNYLSGKDKDRVKCVRLRGEMSFGLVIDVPDDKDWEVGYDCCEDLGILKYDPPIRAQAGDAAREDPYFLRYTNIENMRNFPCMFKDGEKVVATEKIDGSNLRISLSSIMNDDGEIITEWKAGSHKVKRKMPSDEDIKNNTYWFPYDIPEVKIMIEDFHNLYGFKNVQLFGEVYGAVRGGHKSLHYGVPNSLNFVAFDLMLDGKYMDWIKLDKFFGYYGVPSVPIIEQFEFSMDKIKELSTGDSILASKNGAKHMREGIVVKPLWERRDPKMGRVVLKMLNDDYLILKNKAYDKGEITDYKDE